METRYISLNEAIDTAKFYEAECDPIPRLIDGLNAIEPADVVPAPRWIPVEERLPEDRKKCLLWYEYYHYSYEEVLPEYGIGYYIEKYGMWFGDPSTGKDVKVLYWMPLPKPPKEGGWEE